MSPVVIPPKRFSSTQWQVPVVLWLARDALPEDTVCDSSHVALCDLAIANALLRQNGTGIELVRESLAVLSGDDTGKVGLGCEKRVSKAFRPAGKLNVYYTSHLSSGAMGYACDVNQKFAIYIGPYSWPQTLAHEIGHVMGLEHPDLYADHPLDPHFTETNIMWQGAAGRTVLTLGQTFRMSALQRSALNQLGFRDDATETCEVALSTNEKKHLADAVVDDDCPRISLP